jgi:hypothetical protein
MTLLLNSVNDVHDTDDHLTSLGNKLMERPNKEKSMHILDQAISILEFTPAVGDHPNRGPRLSTI